MRVLPIFVSVVLHSMLLLVFVVAEHEVSAPKDDTIEITKFDDERPVVQSAQIDKSEKPKDKAKYLGEFTQRVEKETQALAQGLFRNSTGLLTEENFDADAPDAKLRELFVPGAQNSALPDDVERGADTLLNTDEVIYAGFINRIREDVYGPWVKRIQRFVDSKAITGSALSENLYITKLRINLSTDGRIVSIQTLRSSGISGVDEASRNAFWDVEPFMNPPKLASADIFPLVFEFQFEYKSSFFGIVPHQL